MGHVEDVEVEQVIVNQLAKHRFSWRYHIISLLSTNKEEFHRGSSTNWSSTHFPEEIIWFLCCLCAKAGGFQLWHFLFSTDSIYFITCNNAPNDSLYIFSTAGALVVVTVKGYHPLQSSPVQHFAPKPHKAI